MAPHTRGWRRNFQLGDENRPGLSLYGSGSGSRLGRDDATLSLEQIAQEEPTADVGRGEPSQPIKKKTRGPTYMKDIWGLRGNKRIKVEATPFGQPIGKTKSQFVEFLGTVAKNGSYAPIHIKRWDDMPSDKKKDMLNTVKEKFELPPGMETSVLQKLGKRWRNWKAELKAKFFDQNKPIEAQKEIAEERVMKDQWVELITHWKSEDAQKLSMRNKEIRKKKTLHHRTGKKSFAQLGVEMKEEQGHSPSRVVMFKKWYTDKSGNPRSDEVANAIIDMDERTARLSPGKSDKIAPNDIFAQVRGEERNGRVRMLGDGVAPSDLWDVIPSRNTIYRQSMEQKKAYEEMKNKCNETIELLNEERAQMAEFLASNNRQRANGSEHNLGGSTSTGRSFAPRTQALRVNAYVALKSVCDASKTVALGYIQSLDPENVVGGRTLGDKWCEVLVQVPVEPKERLIRPYDMFDNIEDVVGCPIAWPIALVVREEVWSEAHDTMTQWQPRYFHFGTNCFTAMSFQILAT